MRGLGFGSLLLLSLGLSCGDKSSSNGGDAAPTCPAGQAECAGGCVYLDFDAQNCGACGTACGAAQTCDSGSCTCPASTTACGADCVDAATDRLNCGECGTACGTGELCAAGACACEAGLTACAAGCVDTQSSGANCGGCDQACEGGLFCSAGGCVDSCPAGLAACGQDCVDLAISEQHCGACDAACAAGQSCDGGSCSCPSDQLDCGGCVNPLTSMAHCGDCGVACLGGQVCTAGQCECSPGEEVCAGQCVDTQTNPLHCGACDQACAAGTCAAGTCVGGGTGGTSSGGTGGTSSGGAGGTGGTSSGGTGGTIEPPTAPLSPYIVVDQFGYLPTSEKLAVLRDPQEGWDASESFTPGASYALIDAATGAQVLTAAPAAWNGGATDPSSGDRAYWFDFSSVTAPGTYYVLDVSQNVRSAVFRIANDVYREVLEHAMRTFFYQRAGQDKTAATAGAPWADGPSHLGPLQDGNCRRWNAAGDASTERDLSGGWYDAGDYNKYTNWHAGYVVSMLRAYHHYPTAFGDDTQIPESGNGTPDVLDEAKWGLDWLIKMQNPDGSVLSIVGLASGSPPSSATGQSLYGDANTSATLSTAAAFAYGATVFRAAGMTAYADDLQARAVNAWGWALANPNVTFRNNDGATAGLGAGQQEMDDDGRFRRKFAAAVYLYEATGDTQYRSFVDDNYATIHLIAWGYAYPYEETEQETLLYYTTVAGATAATVTAIRNTYQSAMNGDDNFTAYDTDLDPYRAHLDSYTWGSNATKSAQGNMFAALEAYGLSTARTADARNAAQGYLHYLHGVNPFGLVYLSNMNAYGADQSVTQFFHSWFSDDSAQFDEVTASTPGPAPGFLAGGPNPSYAVDGCCPGACGSPQNNALCTSESLAPPAGQPAQKSYKDFNTGWPLNSWSVTENSNGYQIQYIRLLASFVE